MPERTKAYINSLEDLAKVVDPIPENTILVVDSSLVPAIRYTSKTNTLVAYLLHTCRRYNSEVQISNPGGIKVDKRLLGLEVS